MGCGMCGMNDAFKKGIGGKGDHHCLLKVGQSMVSDRMPKVSVYEWEF